jgi:outer membrane immunogenic protein
MRIIASLLFLLLAFPAAAADLGNSVKDVTIITQITPNPFSGIYVGVMAGAQSTDITFTDTRGDDYSGLNADGFLVGGHLGYNVCTGRLCFGIETEGAFSDVALHLGDFGDVLQMEDYIQLTGHIGVRAGESSMLYVKGGYEWQNWTAGIDGSPSTDISATAAVIGGGIKTIVSPQLAIGLEADYLILDEFDVDGKPAGFNDDLNDAFEDSDAWRVKLRASWYPNVAAPSLESMRF